VPFECAIGHKLDTAIEACGIQPGWRVLDIGAGWGAFTEHAGKRGVRVTSLTISAESERYVNELIARENLPCQVIREHFLEYASKERYDAIVNLGVTEHLPDYAATLAQYEKLLKPGGRVFLDACASRTKYPFSSFVLSHVWPGNATPLKLADYLNAVEKTPFELIYARNDRRNYLLTTKRWAGLGQWPPRKGPCGGQPIIGATIDPPTPLATCILRLFADSGGRTSGGFSAANTARLTSG
jgi:cyclopropane-fatty-acyl-phospholipid synthase